MRSCAFKGDSAGKNDLFAVAVAQIVTTPLVRAGALVALLPDHPRHLYDCHALWLQTPHLPLKVRLAVDALAAALPKLMA